MTNDYFDASTYTLTPGTRARAADINTAYSGLETGLDKLPSENNIKRGMINYSSDTGVADAYVVTLTYDSALSDGTEVVFKASNSNTGACTLNVNSLGARSITRQDGSTPVAGDVGADKFTIVRYNGTSDTYNIIGSVGAQTGSGTMASQNANAVSITGGSIDVSSLSLSSTALTASAKEVNDRCYQMPSRTVATTGSTTINSSYTSRDTVDLGTLTLGDMFTIYVHFYGTKDPTAGENRLGVSKSSGTGTVDFFMGDASKEKRLYIQSSAGVDMDFTIPAYASANGTYVLSIDASSAGSDTVSAVIDTVVVFQKKQ